MDVNAVGEEDHGRRDEGMIRAKGLKGATSLGYVRPCSLRQGCVTDAVSSTTEWWRSVMPLLIAPALVWVLAACAVEGRSREVRPTQGPGNLPCSVLTSTTTLVPPKTQTPEADAPPTAIPTTTLPENMPNLEGLRREWDAERGRWCYVDPDTGKLVAFWVADGPSGRLEIAWPSASSGEWQLSAQWRGLFYEADYQELADLFEQQAESGDAAFLLPVDPAMAGMTLSFVPAELGDHWSVLVSSTGPILIRAPTTGVAYPMAYGSDMMNPEGQDAILEYAPGKYLIARSRHHRFFEGDYKLLPGRESTVEIGQPFLSVPPGDDDRASVWIASAYDLGTYNTEKVAEPELSRILSGVSTFLHPEHLLRTADGRIVYLAEGAHFPVSWYAPTGRIAFQASLEGNWGIYLMNADGSNVVNFTNTPDADEFSPAWSPDGQRIAFIRRVVKPEYVTDIYVASVDGMAAERLTNNDVRDASCLNWSPDGRHLAFSALREVVRASDNAHLLYRELYKMDVATREKTRLTDVASYVDQDLGPRWSPDGRRIAFQRLHHSERNWEIYLVNADGSGLTRLTDNPGQDSDPAWSPDGDRVVFFSVRGGPGTMHIMNADGSDVTPLGGGPGHYEMDWSPDGRYILFVPPSSPQIWVMTADGSKSMQLTDGFEHARSPSWAPARR